MKILVLSYEYPPIGGGGGVICQNISENLASGGNEVTVLTTVFPGSSNQSKGSLRIIRLPARRKKAFESNPVEMLCWITATKTFIKKNPGFIDFDLCMAHFVLPGGEVALWLKRKFGLPYVLISHGHDIPWIHPRQMFLMHLAAFLKIKQVCRGSDLVFVQTRMMKANLDRFMGKEHVNKHLIVPNGVDAAQFFPDYPKRSRKLRIIFGGRLVLQKDPMTFLKAIRLLAEQTREFEVHILGDGKLRSAMEYFVETNELSGMVKFLGRLGADRMLEEYQAAHLMVSTSLNEGMSIAALEALACGVYVIATRASGFPDMIRDGINGKLINFKDPYQLSLAISQFHQTCFWETTAESERYRVEFVNNFSWSTISNKYLEIVYINHKFYQDEGQVI